MEADLNTHKLNGNFACLSLISKGNNRRRHKIKFVFPPGGGENNGSLVPARNNNQVYRNQVAGTVEEIGLPLKKKSF